MVKSCDRSQWRLRDRIDRVRASGADIDRSVKNLEVSKFIVGSSFSGTGNEDSH